MQLHIAFPVLLCFDALAELPQSTFITMRGTKKMSSKTKSNGVKQKQADDSLPPELMAELRGARDRSADYDLVVDVLQEQSPLTLNDILISVYKTHARVLKRSQLIGLLAGLKRNGRVTKDGGNYRLSQSESAQAN